MPYTPPLRDFAFILDHVAGFDQVRNSDLFGDATPDTVQAILSEGGRLCAEVIAPLRRPGDTNPARLDNGAVVSPPGYAEGFRALAEGGWIGISADPEHGGMGMPQTVSTAFYEMMSSACLSLQMNPLLTQGQIEALEHHASDKIKALYLPKLISGEWSGTMNLTEPQAGTDLAALRSKAEPQEDGTYSVSGQKIYISWGDCDFTQNVCHLVLARLPDAPAGSKGISLFLVPKIIPNADGSLGQPNALRVVSLEHKLGIHGSPTCVMEYDGATGWLVGAPHKGLAAMFTMMNNARVGVGVQGIGVAEGAYQHALAYAMDRKQGPTPKGATAIIDHPDIRRQLAIMRAEIFAARAIAMANCVAIDMATATGSADWAARAGWLTPITKTYGTETGITVSDMGIQIHGGMGFIEETGAAQFLRDVRVTAIYEGTNAIQALDLVGRKLGDGGAAAFALLDEVAETAAASDMGAPVSDAAQALRSATDWMLGQGMAERAAAATAYLRAFARVLGADMHLRAAQSGEAARVSLARVYIDHLLPECAAHLTAMRADPASYMALSAEDLGA
ncbi:3-methylmercaptopropionyl-CoA dehydrogenase [Roseibaca ekhonensis]|jgi:alkylation response protein AidB-like acyl-CoA dehydrogenase|uniref:3-methylmercaptopropionyl-CoA dehydrogenase n=1 Tax=Roseinatronobacter ekhonensis TaxID=254356 RepID=A0A3B0M4P5_9RHOB|nr:acyl-CoA dehydrogenase [Roseibaca ekhonensis]SUZ31002.1 3-methylmercaptopropionyl-CoA dehydrogenase [Roseibaca ekhonensis]